MAHGKIVKIINIGLQRNTNMKKILINAPVLSASGYGEMARFALRTLRQHQDKFDIYLNLLNLTLVNQSETV